MFVKIILFDKIQFSLEKKLIIWKSEIVASLNYVSCLRKRNMKGTVGSIFENDLDFDDNSIFRF